MKRPKAGPFHGLTPYDEAEESLLRGRDAERAALLALARDPGPRTILCTGEVGSGKTSLLRAGLVPAGPRDGVLPIYLELGPSWELRLRDAVARSVDRPLSVDDDPPQVLAAAVRERKLRPVLILDPVEMLLFMEEPEVEALRRTVGEYRKVPGLALVVAVDRGNLHAVARLGESPIIPHDQTVTLGRWEGQRAGEVLEQTILAGGGYMEAGLPQTFAADLCDGGATILPATLQMAGHAAVSRGITDRAGYLQAGGARALVTFYVEGLAARAGGWRARRVLAVLSEQPSPRVLLSLEEVARGAGLSSDETSAILGQLEEQGLVRNYPPPPAALGTSHGQQLSGHTILHPCLRQPIRDYAAPVQRARALARIRLERRARRDQLLRPLEAVAAWRILGTSLEEAERTRLQRSLRIWAAAAAVLLTLPALAVVVLYLMMNAASHLDVVPGPAGVHRVVLQSGTPTLDVVSRILPGRFHEVEVDTGLSLSTLERGERRPIAEGAVRGKLRKPAARPPWAARLSEALTPLRRAVFLALAGERDTGGKRLLESARNRPPSRRQAVIWGALLFGDSAETREILLQGSGDRRPEVRLLVVEKARALGGSVAVALAERALRDADSQVRIAALQALKGGGPDKTLPLLWPMIWDVDLRVQEEALRQLEAIARSRPLPVLDLLLEKWDREAQVRAGASAEKAKDALARLMQGLLAGNPRQVAAHLVSKLVDTGQRPDRVEMLLQWLAATADQVDADRVQPALTRLTVDRNLLVRAAALSLQARFDQPEVAQARLAQLARTTQPAAQAAAMRRAAAVGLGLIKAPLNRDRFNLLKALARDRDAGVRSAAIRSLLQIGQLGLLEVARAMKAGPPDLAQAALQEVCRPSMSTRTVTTVLGVAWKLKKQNMRARALACAQSLADASLRLRLWLADQAAKDKDPLVRRAGAAAAAAALRDGGAQFARLAKLYLGDRDPELRTSFLQAVGERPPSTPGFLFDLVARTARDGEAKVRAAAAGALVAVAATPTAAVKVLGELLRDPDPRVQRAAVGAASQLRGDARALDAPLAALIATAEKSEDALAAVAVAGKLKLIDALRRGGVHRDGEVRATALEAIVPHVDPAEALPILEAAMRDPKPEVRELALRAIGRMDVRLGKRAAELLWQGALSSESAQRQTAFAALGRLQGPGAKHAGELLRAASRDPSEERRRLAVAALGQVVQRDPAAADALVAAVEDPSHDVRGEARAALASYLAHSRLDELWALLLASERRSLERRLAIAALALHGRRHGTFRLGQLVTKLPAETPIVTQIAARLALSLSRSNDPPEPLLAWLYGW